MASSNRTTPVYEELAEWYHREGQTQLRDRYFVLAADAALAAGTPDAAERLRGRLLQVNPHHLLKPYRSFSEALKNGDIQRYVGGLRGTHPPDEAARLLESLRTQDPAAAARPIPHATLPAPRALYDIYLPTFDEEPEKDMTDPLPPKSQPVRAKPPHEVPDLFRVLDEDDPPDVPRTQPLPALPPHAGAAVSTRTAPVPVARPLTPRPAQEVYPFRNEPLAPRALPPAPEVNPEAEEAASGAWFASLLYVLLLVAGIALAGLTLGRPFLDPRWGP